MISTCCVRNHGTTGDDTITTRLTASYVLSLVNFYMPVVSVRPIVRTSRTAFVCASDYDDRTQFHMFEQKNEHGKKLYSNK